MSHNKTGLKAGLKGSISTLVEKEHTASYMGSGNRNVLATPMLVSLFEAAAQKAIEAYLSDNDQTVGVHLDLTHEKATPLGMHVQVDAELMLVNGRTLLFQLNARDEIEAVAFGTHTRTMAAKTSLDRLLQKKLTK